MADNYGLDAGGNVVIQQPAQAGTGPATRIDGGGSVPFSGFGDAPSAPGNDFGGAANASMRTLDAVNKLTQGILNQAIEREQKRQYYEGMAQVAQGKTLMEVEKEQPWYTKIFGPAASVQGAQAMTMMGALNKAESDFYEALPQLSQKSPDEAREWLVNQFSQIPETGDPNMDAMIQAKLAEQMPTLMGQHMKQHLRYVQDQNNIAYGNTLMTAGKTLQDKVGAGAGFFTPEQLDRETQRALFAFEPMPGMTPDAWRKNVVSSLRSGMMQGNFAVYEAFKKSPMWGKLTTDQQAHLDDQVLPYATQWVQRNNPSYMDRWMDQATLQVSLLHGAGPQSAGALTSWLDAQNKKWEVQSGSTQPLYDNAARGRMEAARQKGMLYLQHQQAIAQKARDKAAAQANDVVSQEAAVQWSLNYGAMSPMLSNVSPDVAQRALDKSWQNALASNDQDKITNQINKLSVASAMGSKMVNKSLSSQWTTTANNFLTQGVSVTDSMKQNLGFMRTMTASPNGIAALGQYIGGENAAKMVAFIRSGVDMDKPSDVDAVRTAIMRNFHAPVSKQDRKDVANFLADNDGVLQRNLPIFGQGALAPYELNDATKARLGALLTPEVARFRASGVGGDAAVPLAFSIMFNDPSRVDYVDGTLSEVNPASHWKSMFSTVSEQTGITNQGSADYQQALTATINDAMSKALGKVPVPTKPQAGLAKSGNGRVQTANEYSGLVPDPRGFTDQQQPTSVENVPEGMFDPNDYVSVTARQIAPGVLQVERLPAKASPDMHPVTVTIKAADVVANYHKALKDKADAAQKQREVINQLVNNQSDPTMQ